MEWARRITSAALALIAAGFIARGAHDATPPVPEGYTVVRYWEKWTGAEAEQMQQIVADFNATVGHERHIAVQYMSMSNIDQKTLVAIAAGVPPDVAGLWDQQVAQYAALGAVEPLDELAAAHGISEQTYLPVYWNGCRYAGHLYGLVSTPATIALHYNK